MCWELCNGGCHKCDVTWLWGSYCGDCNKKIAAQKEQKKSNLSSLKLEKFSDFPDYSLKSSSFRNYNLTPRGSRLRYNSLWDSSSSL